MSLLYIHNPRICVLLFRFFFLLLKTHYSFQVKLSCSHHATRTVCEVRTVLNVSRLLLHVYPCGFARSLIVIKAGFLCFYIIMQLNALCAPLCSFLCPVSTCEFSFTASQMSTFSVCILGTTWRTHTMIWCVSFRNHSLSMSLYFFLRMETWSLNNTGSSLIWECTRGMRPSQRLKAFMQVCRWAKWSGSAHRDDLEPLVWRNTNERVAQMSGIRETINPHSKQVVM